MSKELWITMVFAVNYKQINAVSVWSAEWKAQSEEIRRTNLILSPTFTHSPIVTIA